MDRCPTCGAAVRPGAKFCTSCGSRLGDHVPGTSDDSTWGRPPSTEADTQETRADTPAVSEEEATRPIETTPEPHWDRVVGDPPGEPAQDEEATTTSDSDWPTSETATETEEDKEEIPANEGTSWSSQWPGSETGTTATGTDSPASRFEAGLDDEASTTEEEAPEEPAPPARSTWSWRSASTDEEAADVETGTATEAPGAEAADVSEESQAEPLREEASVSGDLGVAATSAGATTVEGQGQEARQRASDLVDELRQLVWTIGVDETPGAGHKNTIQNMSRVRGETNDFADLLPVIEAVRENPRDIDALRELGEKAGRLQELLDSHGRLTSALDEVIGDLR